MIPWRPSLWALGALQTPHRQDLVGLGRQAPQGRLGGTGLCTMLAGDEIDALEGGLVAADVEDLALDTGHLGRMGKRHIAV